MILHAQYKRLRVLLDALPHNISSLGKDGSRFQVIRSYKSVRSLCGANKEATTPDCFRRLRAARPIFWGPAEMKSTSFLEFPLVFGLGCLQLRSTSQNAKPCSKLALTQNPET